MLGVIVHSKKLLEGCEVDKEHEDLTLGVATKLGWVSLGAIAHRS